MDFINKKHLLIKNGFLKCIHEDFYGPCLPPESHFDRLCTCMSCHKLSSI